MIVNNAASRCSAGFWSDHLQNEEQNERADLKEIRGLRADTLAEALEEMERQAQINPRVKNFMYHADFNPCPHEHLTEAERDRAFEIFEKKRGIPDNTPRIVVEHVKNGRKHWHVIWFRLDEQGRPFSDKLDAKIAHSAAREIENELGLQKVIGPFDREAGMPRPPRGPRPYEMYRGLKTGIDPRDITAEVTELFKQSDSGKAFQAALEQHRYPLCTGNRGLLILDSAGNEHSLARRIDGTNTKELNAFMRDVDRQTLPTVEQAKAHYQERKIEGLEADRATVAQEIEWEEALSNAAIAKEQKERQFIDPLEREKKASAFAKATADKQAAHEQQEKAWPTHPPPPEAVRGPESWSRPEHSFENAAADMTRPEPGPAMPENFKGASEHIWTAWHQSDNAKAFAAALDEKKISLAAVTKEDAERSHRTASFAKEIGNYAPRYREGEIVAIGQPYVAYDGDLNKVPEPRIYRLNERTTGESQKNIERFLKTLDRSGLQGIDATKGVIATRVEQRINEIIAIREQRDADLLKRSQEIYGRDARTMGDKENISNPATAMADAGTRLFGKGLHTAVKAATGAIEWFADFFGASTPPPLEQILKARDAREEAAEQASDFFARRSREDDDADRRKLEDRAEKVAEDEDRHYRKKREREYDRDR